MGRGLVLITRPRSDADRLSEHLNNIGFETLIDPMLNIKDLQFEAAGLDRYQAFIFTSANAVRAFARRTDIRDIPVFVVGPKTAEAAQNQGFSDVRTASGTVEALKDMVRLEIQNQSAPLLYVRGTEVSYPLSEQLKAAGHDVDKLEVYEAVLSEEFTTQTRDAIQNDKVAGVTFFSVRTVEAFIECIEKASLGERLNGIKALCISESVLKCVQSFSWEWKGVYAAKDENSDGVVTLLKQHISENEFKDK